MKIALITPIHKEDYLVNTVIDGLLHLIEDEPMYLQTSEYVCKMSSNYPLPKHSSYATAEQWKTSKKEFIEFAKTADLIILFWGKGNTDYELAKEINCWDKTVYVDGSEVGGNRRLDPVIVDKLLQGKYLAQGSIDQDMLNKCPLYFRRERPYRTVLSNKGTVPLPFGIERRYVTHIATSVQKDIDFVCIFGQDEYPLLRREVRKSLERFCKTHNLVCATKSTKKKGLLGLFGLKKDDGREAFYTILSRAKVGISVGGGGFDTARFWEILGNDCMLMTETIGLYEEGSTALDYQRITQFKDLADFERALEKVAASLATYDQFSMKEEYSRIMAEHSTKARVMFILDAAKAKRII